MRKAFSGFVVLAYVLSLTASAFAATFDSNNTVFAGNANYWPYGDADNTRYQLWLSDSMLSGYSGTVKSITNYLYDRTDPKIGSAAYSLNLYLSTTPLASGALSATDLDSNNGPDRTLVFSGMLPLTGPEINIDVADIYSYSGVGNLLIDYVFTGYYGVANYYDGPMMQSVDSNTDLFRVTQHNLEGNHVYDWGADRTAIEFGPIGTPLPAAPLGMLLMGSLASLAGLKRRKK